MLRNGEPLIGYTYREDGRLAAIEHVDRRNVRYRYDKRGFRTRGDYAERVAARLRYDSAGNLVRYELRSPDATVAQDYEIGRNNQVLRIRNTGPDSSPTMAFRYDEAGRLLAMDAGTRTAAIAHDGLDRVTDITLDGQPLLAYTYDPLDLDAIVRADRITANVAVAPGTSQVFGTLDSIVYARPRLMEHGAVVYVPALKAFAPRWDHLAPDAVLRSSLQRRAMPIGQGTPSAAPFGYDKPSNSLFIPPEYNSINCRVCSSSIQGATFTASSGARVGEAVEFRASVTGTCTETGLGFYGSPSWHHSLAFGDGHVASVSSFANVLITSHVYRASGTFTATDAIACGCAALGNLARRIVSVLIEPAPLSPPGDCTTARHRALQDRVDDLCKARLPRACSKWDGCALLGIKRQGFARCHGARTRINRECFRGGDADHIQAVENIEHGRCHAQL